MAKKSLGQHWLRDGIVLNKVAEAASLEPTDTVLEIGPGQGDLTRVLATKVKKVVACEIDEELVPSLRAKLPKNVEVVASDILQFDLHMLPAHYKVVANVPYYITAKIIQKLLTSNNPPTVTVLLIQKEVAKRLTSNKHSMLSLSAEVFAEVSLGMEIAAKFFSPPPKVDSQVVILNRREEPLVSTQNQKAFFRVAKAGFSAKRKKLRSSLSGGLQLDKTEVEALLQSASISPDVRAEELSVADWLKLSKLVRDV